MVSIPSSGSIQFLQGWFPAVRSDGTESLNPLKRVNSILTIFVLLVSPESFPESQSPQAGQFNSYKLYLKSPDIFLMKLSQSPQAGQFNSYFLSRAFNISEEVLGLNPLKRVNSILT